MDLYRTDQHGTVVVHSTVMTYTVKSEFEQGWVVGHAPVGAAYSVTFSAEPLAIR